MHVGSALPAWRSTHLFRGHKEALGQSCFAPCAIPERGCCTSRCMPARGCLYPVRHAPLCATLCLPCLQHGLGAEVAEGEGVMKAVSSLCRVMMHVGDACNPWFVEALSPSFRTNVLSIGGTATCVVKLALDTEASSSYRHALPAARHPPANRYPTSKWASSYTKAGNLRKLNALQRPLTTRFSSL